MTTVISIWAGILYISACWDLTVIHKVSMRNSLHHTRDLILVLLVCLALMFSYSFAIIGAPPFSLPYESYCVILYVTIGAITAVRVLEDLCRISSTRPYVDPSLVILLVLAVLLAPVFSLSLRFSLITDLDWPDWCLENPHFKEKD